MLGAQFHERQLGSRISRIVRISISGWYRSWFCQHYAVALSLTQVPLRAYTHEDGRGKLNRSSGNCIDSKISEMYGASKLQNMGEFFLRQVVTLWYRAPEILLGHRKCMTQLNPVEHLVAWGCVLWIEWKVCYTDWYLVVGLYRCRDGDCSGTGNDHTFCS